MRDSLSAGPCPRRRGDRDRIPLKIRNATRVSAPAADMPTTVKANNEKTARGRSRRGSPSPSGRRNADSTLTDVSGPKKRPRELSQEGGTSSSTSSVQLTDTSNPSPPERKRGRSAREDRPRRQPAVVRPSTPPPPPPRARNPKTTTNGAESRVAKPSSNRSNAPSIVRKGSVSHVTATASLPSPFRPPVREVRSRPIDLNRPLDVYVLEDAAERARAAVAADKEKTELEKAVRDVEVFARGGRRSSSGGGSGSSRGTGVTNTNTKSKSTTGGVKGGRATGAPTAGGRGTRNGTGAAAGPRRLAALRSGSVGVRGRSTSASPGRRATVTTTATTAGAEVAPTATPAKQKIHVPIPHFRLHGLFSDPASRNSKLAGEGRASGAGIGAGRKRPAAAVGVGGSSGSGSIAPPRPPRGGAAAAGDPGSRRTFLEEFPDPVRTSHVVRANEYDMDDEDMAFLRELNNKAVEDGGGGSAGGRDMRGLAGEDWPLSMDLFEAMIERLERQDTRARDVRCDG